MVTYKGNQYNTDLDFISEVLKDISNAIQIYRLSLSKLSSRTARYASLDVRELKLMMSKYSEREIKNIDEEAVKRRRSYSVSSDERLKECENALTKENSKKIMRMVTEYTDYNNALACYSMLLKCLNSPLEHDYKEFCAAKVDYESQAHIYSNILSLLNKLQEYFRNLKAKQMN